MLLFLDGAAPVAEDVTEGAAADADAAAAVAVAVAKAPAVDDVELEVPFATVGRSSG